jgi:hypothetical protein
MNREQKIKDACAILHRMKKKRTAIGTDVSAIESAENFTRIKGISFYLFIDLF